METNRTKMVSLRMSRGTAELVERYIASRPYLSKSNVIEKCVSAMLRCATEQTRDKILNSYDPYDDGYILTASKNL